MASIAEILKQLDIDDEELKAYAAIVQTDTATCKRVIKFMYYLQEVEGVNTDMDNFFWNATDVYIEDRCAKNGEKGYEDWFESEYREDRVDQARRLFNKYNV